MPFSNETRARAAEVIALDINSARELDLAPRVRAAMTEADLDRRFGAGFEIAHARLRSRVNRVHCNVYDATPDRLGRFDLVHCGDLLLHLDHAFLEMALDEAVDQRVAPAQALALKWGCDTDQGLHGAWDSTTNVH